jgi:hypothetical protein
LLSVNSSGDIICVTSDPQASVLAERTDFEHRDSAICSIAGHKKGFLTASEGGYLTAFDATVIPNKFVAINCVRLFGDESPITAHTFAIDPTEETALVSLSNNRVLSIALSTGEQILNEEEKLLQNRRPVTNSPINSISRTASIGGENNTIREVAGCIMTRTWG